MTKIKNNSLPLLARYFEVSFAAYLTAAACLAAILTIFWQPFGNWGREAIDIAVQPLFHIAVGIPMTFTLLGVIAMVLFVVWRVKQEINDRGNFKQGPPPQWLLDDVKELCGKRKMQVVLYCANELFAHVKHGQEIGISTATLNALPRETVRSIIAHELRHSDARQTLAVVVLFAATAMTSFCVGTAIVNFWLFFDLIEVLKSFCAALLIAVIGGLSVSALNQYEEIFADLGACYDTGDGLIAFFTGDVFTLRPLKGNLKWWLRWVLFSSHPIHSARVALMSCAPSSRNTRSIRKNTAILCLTGFLALCASVALLVFALMHATVMLIAIGLLSVHCFFDFRRGVYTPALAKVAILTFAATTYF